MIIRLPRLDTIWMNWGLFPDVLNVRGQWEQLRKGMLVSNQASQAVVCGGSLNHFGAQFSRMLGWIHRVLHLHFTDYSFNRVFQVVTPRSHYCVPPQKFKKKTTHHSIQTPLFFWQLTPRLLVLVVVFGGVDCQVLLKNDELLRKKLLLAMWEGPYFAKAVANVIGMDPGPLPEIPTVPKEAIWWGGFCGTPNGGDFCKGNGTPYFFGKSRLVKYYNLARMYQIQRSEDIEVRTPHMFDERQLDCPKQFSIFLMLYRSFMNFLFSDMHRICTSLVISFDFCKNISWFIAEAARCPIIGRNHDSRQGAVRFTVPFIPFTSYKEKLRIAFAFPALFVNSANQPKAMLLVFFH